MSLATQYDLTMDAAFRNRSMAAAVDAAVRFIADPRKDVAALSASVISLADNGSGVIKLAARSFPTETDPDNITDAQLTAAVDAAWPLLAAATFPDIRNNASVLPTG